MAFTSSKKIQYIYLYSTL